MGPGKYEWAKTCVGLENHALPWNKSLQHSFRRRTAHDHLQGVHLSRPLSPPLSPLSSFLFPLSSCTSFRIYSLLLQYSVFSLSLWNSSFDGQLFLHSLTEGVASGAGQLPDEAGHRRGRTGSSAFEEGDAGRDRPSILTRSCCLPFIPSSFVTIRSLCFVHNH